MDGIRHCTEPTYCIAISNQLQEEAALKTQVEEIGRRWASPCTRLHTKMYQRTRNSWEFLQGNASLHCLYSMCQSLTYRAGSARDECDSLAMNMNQKENFQRSQEGSSKIVVLWQAACSAGERKFLMVFLYGFRGFFTHLNLQGFPCPLPSYYVITESPPARRADSTVHQCHSQNQQQGPMQGKK